MVLNYTHSGQSYYAININDVKLGFVFDLCPHGGKSNKETGEDPIKLFFLSLLFSAVKLGHFIINEFFLYVTNMQVYHRKTEKFFVSKEKTFYRIGYRKGKLIEKQ
jgi:hypothetical protein